MTEYRVKSEEYRGKFKTFGADKAGAAYYLNSPQLSGHIGRCILESRDDSNAGNDATWNKVELAEDAVTVG